MNRKNRQQKNKFYALRSKLKAKGFTLIEFLVVLSIIVFIVPSLFGLMFSLLRQQSRIIALQEVKRQGDLVYNHMKTTIKNSATGTYRNTLASPIAICTIASTSSSGGAMYFLSATGVNSYFGYSMTGTGIEYEKTGFSPTPLTNSNVTISNLVLGCTRDSDYSPSLVNVSYTVTEPNNNVSLDYKTLIKLKSH